MKRLLLSALLGVPFFVLPVQAAQKTFLVNPNQTFTFVNNGTVTPTSPIDAINFVNNGTFDAITSLPFETSSTVNFTNTGTMTGQPGFFFNNAPASVGQRQASASFFNGNNGLVQTRPVQLVVSNQLVDTSLLRIWANDVINRGTLQVDVSGNIEMFSENATLSRSILAVAPITTAPTIVIIGTNNTFVPDPGLHDDYAVASVFSNTNTLNTRAIWDGTIATAPNISQGVSGIPGGVAGFTISFGTNFFHTQVAGGPEANVNDLGRIPPSGTLVINYDFFQVPDTMDIFTNGSNVPIFSTGSINGAGQIRIPYGTNVTDFVIIMNLGGNPDQGTAWQYTPTIESLALANTNLPVAWYSNVVAVTTVNVTNFPGGATGPTNVTPIFGVYSNIVKGAVFANIPPQFDFNITFTPGRSNFNTIGVLLALSSTNSSTETAVTNYLYFEDTLPQAAPRLLVNALEGTTRPSNYLAWSRQFVPPGPVPGTNGTGLPEANFFVDSGNIFDLPADITSDVVSNLTVEGGSFSAYEMLIDSLAIRPPQVAGGTVSNLVGSIRVHAENLDISNTRLRGEGEIFLQATHLNGSTNAVLDCENLRFDLGAPASGNLVIQGLAADHVEGRIRGTARAWSATWSNTVQLVFGNNQALGPDPTDPTSTNLVVVPAPFTNNASAQYHVFMLDVSALQTSFPVNVFALLMHGTNITVNDQVTVYESFLVDGQTLTLNRNLTFPGAMPVFNGMQIPGTPIRNWVNTNAPTLLFFTNNASLSIANEAHFGDDRPQPYSAFVTRGSVGAASIQISSDYIESDGRRASDAGFGLGSSGILTLQGQQIVFLNGFTIAQNNFATITTTDLAFSNHVLFTGGALTLAVSGNLSDLGTTNTLEASDGVNLLVKPATGDLLNTTIFSVAPRPTGNFITHQWAADDRGAVAAGFLNNAAIGIFSLVANSAVSTFEFAGTGDHNGLYVDVLDLSNLSVDFTNQLQIEDNLIIYFATVILPSGVTVPTGMLPEEFLDGQLNGHLRWVPSFAGPASSVALDINGKNYAFNEALRKSMTIDSDGDGIVNGLDSTPFRAPYAGGANATFTGLFYGTNGVQYLQSGAVSITTTKKGKYSGSLRTGTKKYSFSGKFDSSGADARNIPKSSLSIRLQADLNHISGTIANGTNWTAQLNAERTVYGKSNKAPFSGIYSVTFPGSGDTNNSAVPFADGTGKAKVNTVGKITFNGKLGDGTKMSQTATVSQDGLWPLYVPLYKGKGQILSWQTLSNPDDVGGGFSWIKQPNAAAKAYPSGFKVETNATGVKLQ